MWDVDSGFLDRLTGFRTLSTSLTVTPPGATAIEIGVVDGTVTVDASARVRRSSSLLVNATPAEFASLVLPGAVFEIETGYMDGSTPVRIPVFTGETSSAVEMVADGQARLRLGDLTRWLQRARFLSPYTPTPTLTRLEAMEEIVLDGRPDTVFRSTATDAGLVGSLTWAEDRTDAVGDLGKDGGIEAFFGPDGIYDLRNVNTIASAPVWTIRGGVSGTLKQIERERPLDRLYNTVVVRPSKADGTQTWDQQIAQVTDAAHPRHPDKIGAVPYFWASPTILTAEAALIAAERILDRVLGNTESLMIEAMSNPALEAGDVVRVTSPAIGEAEATSYQHFIDSFTMNLRTGSMNMSTRSQVEVDA